MMRRWIWRTVALIKLSSVVAGIIAGGGRAQVSGDLDAIRDQLLVFLMCLCDPGNGRIDSFDHIAGSFDRVIESHGLIFLT